MGLWTDKPLIQSSNSVHLPTPIAQAYFENIAASAVAADTQPSSEGEPTPEGGTEEEGGIGIWLLGLVLLAAGAYLWKRKRM
jgi:hypothetical protein